MKTIIPRINTVRGGIGGYFYPQMWLTQGEFKMERMLEIRRSTSGNYEGFVNSGKDFGSRTIVGTYIYTSQKLSIVCYQAAEGGHFLHITRSRFKLGLADSLSRTDVLCFLNYVVRLLCFYRLIFYAIACSTHQVQILYICFIKFSNCFRDSLQ